MAINDVLVGKIVAWPNSDETDRLAGHGEIVAALESPFLLVRKRSSRGDPEPSYMLVLGIDEPELAFFDTQDEHDTWLVSTLNDPNPVGDPRTGRPQSTQSVIWWGASIGCVGARTVSLPGGRQNNRFVVRRGRENHGSRSRLGEDRKILHRLSSACP